MTALPSAPRHGRTYGTAPHHAGRAQVELPTTDPSQQTAFARLSVFVGGFTLEGADAVLQDLPVRTPRPSR